MKYILSDIFQGDYPISQKYGERPEYYKQFGLAGHEGVDFATPVGTPILAPFDGVILRDNDDFKNNAYGNFIVVWDSKQLCAVWFCHLSENSVSVGDTVKKGQVLGKTGNSGNSSGPHLHINFVTTDKNGNRLDTDNGYQGFKDILDTRLITWQMGSSIPTPPSNSTSTSPLEAKWTTYTSALNAHKDDVDVNYYTDDPKRIVDDVIKYKNSNEVLTGNNEQLAKNIDALVKAHQKELTDKEAEFERNLSNLDGELLKETQRADEAEKALKEHVCPTWYSGLLQAIQDVKEYLKKHGNK